MISLTYKIIPNTPGWLRVTKIKMYMSLNDRWTTSNITKLNSHEASTEPCGTSENRPKPNFGKKPKRNLTK